MRPMRLSLLPLLALLAGTVSGCMQGPGLSAAPRTLPNPYAGRAPLVIAAAPSAYAPETPAAYTLDAGDRLRISVFGQDGLTNTYPVDASGNVTLPLIGMLPARNLSPQQLARAIAEHLKRGFIRDPQVTVQIEQYRPFFILGEVTTPGQYAFVPNMTAETAVAIAGGFGPRAAKSDITVTRLLNGQTVKADVPLNYPLRPGDTLRIHERWF